MPGYEAGSKRLGGDEKEAEWLQFHAPHTPGNSHCAPTRLRISREPDIPFARASRLLSPAHELALAPRPRRPRRRRRGRHGHQAQGGEARGPHPHDGDGPIRPGGRRDLPGLPGLPPGGLIRGPSGPESGGVRFTRGPEDVSRRAARSERSARERPSAGFGWRPARWQEDCGNGVA